MIGTDDQLILLVWVEGIGVPLREVLDDAEHYARLTARLLASHGDALDIITATTTSPERALILKAGALVRALLDTEPPEE